MTALAKKPRDFEALLTLLQAEGYTVRRSKELAAHKANYKELRDLAERATSKDHTSAHS